MSKTEIIAELTRLSREDLADVRAWLEQREQDNAAVNVVPSPRIRSPRLADPRQAADFAKQVTELPTNAAL